MKHYVRPEADIAGIKRIAVLPFESLIQDEYAGERVRRVVISEILSRNIDVIEPGEVTSFLRTLNKPLGALSNEDIKNLGKALGVGAVMMGSVEAYKVSTGLAVAYPDVSINLRIVDTSSGSIIWSVVHTSGGAGFWTRHFGAEGPTLSEAARKAVKEAIDTLF